MGIKLGNTKMKLGNRTPLVSTPFDIVSNMELTISVENGQWFFSLNGFTEQTKESLVSGKEPIYLQINRFSPGPRKRAFARKILEGGNSNGYFDISEYMKTKFQRINATQWVNSMLYELSTVNNTRGIQINQSGLSDDEKISTGLYYTDIWFTVSVGLIGNYKKKINMYIGKPLITNPQWIRLNFYNTMQPIDTNYNMVDNIINIYAL